MACGVMGSCVNRVWMAEAAISNKPHLLVFISAHGFGHIAQTAPVLNALRQRLPKLRLTLDCAAPPAHLHARIHGDFKLLPESADIGMLMSSALDVRVEHSAAAYRRAHRDWPRRVEEEARRLQSLAPDFILSNVGYLPLAAARLAGIPCAAMCSLNWYDIYSHYCAGLPDADEISQQIRASYAGAEAFLRLTPGMEMADLPNRRLIGPIAEVGRNRRDEINTQLRLAPAEKLVLVSLGGIASRLPIELWPRLQGVRWLVQADWGAAHPAAVVLESLRLPFGDILASSDALICKPGYGSFVEAACGGVPVLYVSRADWPETGALTQWLHGHSLGREVSRQMLEKGTFADELQSLWQAPRPAPIQPTGVAQAAAWLAEKLMLA